MNLWTVILASIGITIQYYADKYEEKDFADTLTQLEGDLAFPKVSTYDFIVVGGGTAGCLLASRLSEHFTVLLLESGGDPVPATYNPNLNAQVATHSAINTFFQIQGLDGFTGVISNGRMLGGSGSHNYNLYNRGSPQDYDYYANFTGDISWSYQHILKHFKAVENFNGKLVQEGQRSEFYGNSGLFYVESDWPPIMDGWFKSASELGYNIGDANGFQKEGFVPAVKMIKNGQRVSTYTSFLKTSEKQRKSLTILRYSTAQQILFRSNNQAYGVLYLRHQIPQIAHASKEVIVSCGTIQSPLLLIKSGIGPSLAHLKGSDLPILEGVGKNFRSHAVISLTFHVAKPNDALLPVAASLQEELTKYQQPTRSGHLSRFAIGPQALFVSSRAKQDGEGSWPDILTVFAQGKNFPGDSENQTILLSVMAARAKSSGEIRFNYTAHQQGEIYDANLAVIDMSPNTDPGDADVLIEGIKIAHSIMENTTTFKSMEVRYAGSKPSPCIRFPSGSKEYWRCYIQNTVSYGHATGTCRMGPDVDDPMAVVDSKLRVRGVQNLRVVDASVLPRPTNGNINAVVLVLAEKTARDILSHYTDSQRQML